MEVVLQPEAVVPRDVVSEAEVVEQYVELLIGSDSLERGQQLLDDLALHQPLANALVLDAQVGVEVAKVQLLGRIAAILQ